jgi:hypothetical protein
MRKTETEEMLEYEGLYEPFKIKSIEIDGEQMFCLARKDGMILSHEDIDKILKVLQPFYKLEKSDEIILEKNISLFNKILG